jgi:hypothetical protein
MYQYFRPAYDVRPGLFLIENDMTADEIRVAWTELCTAERLSQKAYMNALFLRDFEQVQAAFQVVDKARMAQEDFRMKYLYTVRPD